jgi:hypothetical protein
MKIVVTEQGVLIPKNWLPDVHEVDIQKDEECGSADASEHHDRYLYGGAAT